ncbi:MAG: methylmalonyl-CoA mutase [Candidatus Rokubacteria bacterium RIFCSPLOWO2_12_FULL_71_22]|nr:MAG: methylmalonyl-CoA mutase [Candidatus Rokubacteria bacterium RIFCSPLOWO2_12_FULL_71_22]
MPCGIPVEPLYTPADVEGGYLERLGVPGEYPFTRGVYPTMYRGRPWTIRQYAGFGTAEESNRRYRYLLEHGQTGLSVALDLPTQCGYDSDDPMAEAEVGRVGVAIDTLRDMEILFDGLPLDRVSTSFTINGTAAILLAMYVAVAEAQGVAPARIAGTIQNDILKEYVARGTWIFPVEPSLRLIADTIEFCAERLPRFNPISIAGAHFRDAGGTAVQEAAYTLADAFAYVETVRARGIEVDRFAPQLSFFFYTYTDVFEEVAKYRAMRRLWARVMRDRFGARRPESLMFRFGNVCGGHSLTREEPLNNIARVTLGALASVLGGTQSMFTAAWDEAYAIPTEESARTALRIQQILLHESGAARTIDPLAGSYYVEALTERMERAIEAELLRVDAQGGMVRAVETGWVQREIHREAYRQERERQAGTRVVVGVNRFRDERAAPPVAMHRADPALAARQAARLDQVRRTRDGARVAQALAALREGATGKDNLMPLLLDAVRACASVGEIAGVLREVWGVFREPAVV